MKYKEMIEEAKAKGLTSDKIMWMSIDSLSCFMEKVKDINAHLYWDFVREQHGIMHGRHYSETFAEWDVSQLSHTCRDGKKRSGGKWTVEEIETATKDMKFPSSVNKWDKYVAFNAQAADLCDGDFTDDMVLKSAYLFYFKDEDWDEASKDGYSPTKIWDVMRCKYEEK
jgi:hypothetical protein